MVKTAVRYGKGYLRLVPRNIDAGLSSDPRWPEMVQLVRTRSLKTLCSNACNTSSAPNASSAPVQLLKQGESSIS